MFRRGERLWKKYPQDITAASNEEALYLLHYLSYVRNSRCYLQLMEIIDLHRYRIIRNRNKIGRILSAQERKQHFLFPVVKN